MPDGMAQSNGEYHYDKMMFRVPVNSFIVGSFVEWFGIIISWPTTGDCEVWEKKSKHLLMQNHLHAAHLVQVWIHNRFCFHMDCENHART